MMKDIAKGLLVGTVQGFAEGIIGSIICIGTIAALGMTIEKLRESKEN